MSATPADSAAAALRCILWHGADGALPGDLLSSLSRRMGRMTICADGYAALAEVCLVERERRRAQALAEPAPSPAALVLVEPQRLPSAAEVVETIRTYAPSAIVWMYERSANPRLRAVVDVDVARWSGGRGPEMATALPRRAPTTLTEDELRMLLSDEPISPEPSRPLRAERSGAVGGGGRQA